MTEPSFGKLEGNSKKNVEKIDSSNPQEVKQKNENNPQYNDWEMRVFSVEDRAPSFDTIKAAQHMSEVISTLLTCLYNAQGYEKDYEYYMKEFKNLPKLGNFKITKQGDDYDIVEIRSTDTIHVPSSLLKVGIQIAYDKQSNNLLRESMVLKTEIKAFVRKNLGYFDESKAFNGNDYVKMQMMNSAMPMTPEYPTYPEIDDEVGVPLSIDSGANERRMGRYDQRRQQR